MKDAGKAHDHEANAEACQQRSAEHAAAARPAGIADTVDPDGLGFHSRESGFDWTYMSLPGHRPVRNDAEKHEGR